jgi:6-pyruvoyltetrahydropterin/6-carboxytetrahydropterin synthase
MNTKKQYITRKGTFDSMHRVLNERMKCYLPHGHTYLYELEFEFNEMEEIGYAIDFKEIKRVGCQWIDDLLDHGAILNEKDSVMVKAVQELEGKLWLMSLNGPTEYCNPSVENIAKEVFLAMTVLFSTYKDLRIHKVTIHETPNCYTACTKESISPQEANKWMQTRYREVLKYAQDKGIVEYDDRKLLK